LHELSDSLASCTTSSNCNNRLFSSRTRPPSAYMIVIFV
jgi:hypothetical protein